ncbi:hypothetical protein [Chitinophaga sp. CF118]|nr:hypothetical protein [Chitinophaga sp. CF118]
MILRRLLFGPGGNNKTKEGYSKMNEEKKGDLFQEQPSPQMAG